MDLLHALRRDLLYAHEGMIRALPPRDPDRTGMALDLATNAVFAWTTEYYGLAVEQMHRQGRRIDDEVLAHISPAHSENINFFGASRSMLGDRIIRGKTALRGTGAKDFDAFPTYASRCWASTWRSAAW